MYYKKKNQPDPLDCMKGEWIGMLANEIPQNLRITKFVSPAPKVYAIQYMDQANNISYTVKAKGIVSVQVYCVRN